MAANLGEGVIDGTVLRRTWSIHRISPLHNFEISKIERYARQLTRVIRAAFESTLSEDELARRTSTGERASGRFVVRQLADGSGLYVQVEAKLFHANKPQKRKFTSQAISQPESLFARQSPHSLDNGLLAEDSGGYALPLRGQTSMVLLCCTSENTDLLDLDSDYEESSEEEEDEVQASSSDEGDFDGEQRGQSKRQSSKRAQPNKRRKRLSLSKHDDGRKNSHKVPKLKFTVFHFALVKGKGTVVDKICRWLESRFDCSIALQPVPMAPRHLADMASSFTHEALTGRFENVALAGVLAGEIDTDEELNAIDHQEDELAPNDTPNPSASDMHKLEAAEERALRKLELRQQAIQRSRAAQALELTFRFPDVVSEAGLGEINIAVPAGALERLSTHLASGGSVLTSSSSSSGSQFSSYYTGNEGFDTLSKTEMLQRIRNGDSTANLSETTPLEVNTAARTSHLARDNPLLSAINRFIAQQLSIRLNGASLSRIATPLVMVSAEGRVKFLNQDALAVVLRTLAALCQVETQKGK